MGKKIVLITGASKGIGKELAIIFAENNFNIIITYNNGKKEAELLKRYIQEKYKIKIDIIKCDVTIEKEIINLKEFIINKYKKLDILINNAALSLDNNIDDKTKEEFMKVLEVNVCGPFLLTKYLYKYMNNGTIINISSTDAIDTYNKISMDYSASKAALNSLTKTFSQEFEKIKVIGVMPGWTNTEAVKKMNPNYLREELKRIKQEKLFEPREVAEDIYKLINDNEVKSGDIFYECKKNDKKC